MSLVPTSTETTLQVGRQSALHLLTLPPELRHHIYEYCAVNYTAEVSFYSPFRGYSLDPRRFLRAPPLLRTCRQLAREAGPVLSARVGLRFQQGAGSVLSVSACGPVAPSAIRRLHLDLDPSSCEPALRFLETFLLDDPTPTGISTVRVRWSKVGVPEKEMDAMGDACHFWRPAVAFLGRLKGLRVLELVGDYHADFVPCANEALGIEVVCFSPDFNS
ncbi:hypothetical protein Hte_002091 [Hypoxylon texense]